MSNRGVKMFKNKNEGKNNLCGENIRRLRLSYPTRLSQKGLADKMQLIGIDVDKNAIQRIECGKRFVTDIELKAFAEIFDVTLDSLV
jgi:transcriptional regulator with XRE-family HTH domain